jgi:succinate dehydrogenase / fumarate reductase, membrane anchor subunit
MLVRPSGSTGLVPWVLQRVTGALLLLWLSIHLAFWHFRHSHSAGIDAGAVARGASALWVVWGSLLGALCLFHGLSGIRNILFDYGLARRYGGRLTGALWALGLAGLGWIAYNLSLFAAAGA